ncbi:TetR/AcrR family transcriptional regulator [Woodsholea maritima]|uniref:TetR/AcrR family transcriptional regulator n=1 Tax=Woodsholea maritima TaxID=240237 RepID=UPI0003815384|nr:TetR/AcrR family transcriptional regulator [Woodsholea maritima]
MSDMPITRPPAKPVTPDASPAKARVERAALQLFAQQGVDRVSIKQIAYGANLSEGAMYRHYRSKDELARAMFEAVHKRLFELVTAAMAKATSFEGALEGVIRVFCEEADKDEVLFAYYLGHVDRFAGTHHPDRPDPVSAMMMRVKAAMDDGLIPQGDPEVKTAMALGVVMQLATHRMLGRVKARMCDHIHTMTKGAMAVLQTA